jgi:hypothetical protein
MYNVVSTHEHFTPRHTNIVILASTLTKAFLLKSPVKRRRQEQNWILQAILKFSAGVLG